MIGITKFLLLFCVPFLRHGQTNSLLHRNVLDVTQGSHFFFFFWGGGGVFHDIPKMAVKETTKLTGNLKEASGGKDKIKGENENI